VDQHFELAAFYAASISLVPPSCKLKNEQTLTTKFIFFLICPTD
jgi:hypothetical protein